MERLNTFIRGSSEDITTSRLQRVKNGLIYSAKDNAKTIGLDDDFYSTSAQEEFEEDFYKKVEKNHNRHLVTEVVNFIKTRDNSLRHKNGDSYSYEYAYLTYQDQINKLHEKSRHTLITEATNYFQETINKLSKLYINEQDNISSSAVIEETLRDFPSKLVTYSILRQDNDPCREYQKERLQNILENFANKLEGNFSKMSHEQKHYSLAVMKRFQELISDLSAPNSNSNFTLPAYSFLTEELSQFNPSTFKAIMPLIGEEPGPYVSINTVFKYHGNIPASVFTNLENKLLDPQLSEEKISDIREILNDHYLVSKCPLSFNEKITQKINALSKVIADSPEFEPPILQNESVTPLINILYNTNNTGFFYPDKETFSTLLSKHWKPYKKNKLIEAYEANLPKVIKNTKDFSTITRNYLLSTEKSYLTSEDLCTLQENIKKLNFSISEINQSGIDEYLINNATYNVSKISFDNLMPLVAYDQVKQQESSESPQARLADIPNYANILVQDMNSEYNIKLLDVVNTDHVSLPKELTKNFFDSIEQISNEADYEACKKKLNYLLKMSNTENIRQHLIKRSTSIKSLNYIYSSLIDAGHKVDLATSMLDHIFSTAHISNFENEVLHCCTPSSSQRGLPLQQEEFIQSFKEKYNSMQLYSRDHSLILKNLKQFVLQGTYDELANFVASSAIKELVEIQDQKYKQAKVKPYAGAQLGVNLQLSYNYNSTKHIELLDFLKQQKKHITLEKEDVVKLAFQPDFLLDPTDSAQHERYQLATLIHDQGHDRVLYDTIVATFTEKLINPDYNSHEYLIEAQRIAQDFNLPKIFERIEAHTKKNFFDESSKQYSSGNFDNLTAYENTLKHFDSYSKESFFEDIGNSILANNSYSLKETAKMLVNTREGLLSQNKDNPKLYKKFITNFFTKAFDKYTPAELETLTDYILPMSSTCATLYKEIKDTFQQKIIDTIEAKATGQIDNYLSIANKLYDDQRFLHLEEYINSKKNTIYAEKLKSILS